MSITKLKFAPTSKIMATVSMATDVNFCTSMKLQLFTIVPMSLFVHLLKLWVKSYQIVI